MEANPKRIDLTMFGNPFNLLAIYSSVVFRLDEDMDSAGSFFIITADNPGGRLCSETVNRCRSAALLRRLRRYGGARRLHGCCPDFKHCERSFAADLTSAQAYALAREYRQNAVYQVDKGHLFLLFCKPNSVYRNKRIYLGCFSDRIV